MRVSLEKPGTPEEVVALSHHGVKGMHWGVRKDRTNKTDAQRSARRRSTAKKVAIGVGSATVAVGAAYLAYKLNQSGHLPVSSVKTTAKTASEVKRLVKEPTDIIHASRGKTKGFRFFRTGGTDSYFTHHTRAFQDKEEDNVFKRFPDGKIAASFLDPEGRRDRHGRPIPHEVVIPIGMTGGINNLDDVRSKIWPLIKPTYSYE